MKRYETGVSVIIPVFNGEKYIEEALNSVLRQTHPVEEVIVVDDGSHDGTPAILENFRGKIKLIRQENTGIGAAINRGVEAAGGLYLAFLDADDLWVPEKIELQQNAFHEQDVDLVFGMVEQFISPELEEEHRRKLVSPDRIFPGYSSGTLMIARETFCQVGPFSTRYMIGEFIEWFSRAEQAGLSSFMLPEILLKRRLHTSNTTRRSPLDRGDYVKILRSRLEMKRKGLVKDE
jgi:glycosyltransferase involved in cell wall biosynthesis